MLSNTYIEPRIGNDVRLQVLAPEMDQSPSNSGTNKDRENGADRNWGSLSWTRKGTG